MLFRGLLRTLVAAAPAVLVELVMVVLLEVAVAALSVGIETASVPVATADAAAVANAAAGSGSERLVVVADASVVAGPVAAAIAPFSAFKATLLLAIVSITPEEKGKTTIISSQVE